MLHRIYLLRHGETADVSPTHKGHIITPTGNHADVYLTSIGSQQAELTVARLALENLPIDAIYSSPNYQCLETLRPFVTDTDGKVIREVRVENGLCDSQDIDDLYPLCSQQCYLKRPTPVEALTPHFPYISKNYSQIVSTPPPGGWRCETPRRLLLRAHFIIDHIIQELDNHHPLSPTLSSPSASSSSLPQTLEKPTPESPKTVLICTHAPVILALARILTSHHLPHYLDYAPSYNVFLAALRRSLRHTAMVEFCQPDHHAGHASLTRFSRRSIYDWSWALEMNGSQAHLPASTLYRTGAFRFRPSPWQNRHVPHPVLLLCAWYHGLPGSLLWLPTATVHAIDRTLRELWLALRRQLRNNPYRLPPWVYMVLWTLLFYAVSNKIMGLHAAGGDWRAAPLSEEHRQAWSNALGGVCAQMMQFSLFMFPPLLA